MAREQEGRYVGMDLGKRKFDVAIVEGDKVRHSGGVTHPEGRAAFYGQLLATDTVAADAAHP